MHGHCVGYRGVGLEQDRRILHEAADYLIGSVLNNLRQHRNLEALGLTSSDRYACSGPEGRPRWISVHKDLDLDLSIGADNAVLPGASVRPGHGDRPREDLVDVTSGLRPGA